LRNWDLNKIKECALKINANFNLKTKEEAQKENLQEDLS